MKKKLFILLLIPTFVLVLTACGNSKKTIELTDENLGYKTTFTYEKDKDYSEVKENADGASKEISFESKSLDLEFEMYYNTTGTKTFDSIKKGRSEKKYYKEYKFGNYQAYAYGDYDDGLYLNIILDEDKEKNEYAVLFVSIEREDNNRDVIVADVVADKEVQALFNSLKFERIKK